MSNVYKVRFNMLARKKLHDVIHKNSWLFFYPPQTHFHGNRYWTGIQSAHQKLDGKSTYGGKTKNDRSRIMWFGQMKDIFIFKLCKRFIPLSIILLENLILISKSNGCFEILEMWICSGIDDRRQCWKRQCWKSLKTGFWKPETE